MHLSFDRPFWALLFAIGIATTIASCGGSSSGPDIKKLNIISVVPDSGMVGDSVTIKGSGGFASRLSDNILTFNGTPATVLSTTPDQLITKVPEGATSGRLTLEVNDQTVKGPPFKVLGSTTAITGVSPIKATPGTEVRIKGTHFLNGSASTNKTPNDLRPDNKQTKEPLAKNKTNNTASLSAPGAKRPGIGMPSPRSDIPQSKNMSKLKVSAAQNKANATVTTTNADAISITFGGQQAPVHSATDTLLITEVPEGASGNIIEVTVGEQSMEWDAFQLLTPLNVLSLSPESGPVRTPVTVQGEGFHTTADSNIVAFNGIEAEVTAASPTELNVMVPPKAESGAVTVEAHSQTAQGPTFTVTVPTTDLSISGISPTGGPAGTNVTITGQGFSATPSENTVSFDGSQATVSAATTEKLTATVPNGATTGPVSVTIDNETVNGPTFNVSTNSPPTFTSPASLSIKENTSLVDTVVASDIDGDALTFSISGGDDQDLFTIDEQTGVLAFSSTPDYENPSDINADNIYELQVSANDGSLSANQGITITVTDVNENQSPSFTSGPSFNVNENATDIGTLTANDPEGDTITLSIRGGTDQDLFSLDGQSGELSFNTAPDHEAPADADGDNVYEVQVEAADNSGSTSQDIVVEVQNLNDNSPVVTQSDYEMEENKTEVGIIEAMDPDGDELTYELNGRDDEGRFELDSQTGALSFKNPPDYEQPLDGKYMTNGFRDNVYEVGIVVRDGENIDLGSLNVKILNVAEPPLIDRGQIVAGGNEIYKTGSATDPYLFDPVPDGTDLADYLDIKIFFEQESEEVTEVRISGTDADLFSVGQIRRSSVTERYQAIINGPSSLDYNHNANHQYEFTITASTDAGDTVTATFVLPVSPFDGGSVTAYDPYHVSNVDQLQAIGQDKFLDAHFVQIQHIDASITADWNPVPPNPPLTPDPPRGFDPIGGFVFNDDLQVWEARGFEGTYDGNGFSITGLTVRRFGSLERRIGLFGLVGKNGEIKNVHVNGYLGGDSVVGGVAGENTGTISNSSSEAEIYCPSGSCGVLVGTNHVDGIIRNSFATGDIDIDDSRIGGLVGVNNMGALITNSYATGNVTGENSIGGLVGNNSGEIRQSFASGNVTGSQNIGGLVGKNLELIQNSYAIGTVSGAYKVGGLAGLDVAGTYRNNYTVGALINAEDQIGGVVGLTDFRLSDGHYPTFSYSYWDTETTGQSSSVGGTPLNTNQMTGSNASTYMNFDFGNIWQEGASGEYPTLRNNPPPNN